jgi:hypothetical protein
VVSSLLRRKCCSCLSLLSTGVPVQRRYLPTSLILLGRPLAVLKAWFLSVLHPTIHQAWAIEICNCATRGCQYLFDLVHHRSIVFWHFRLSSLPAFSPCPPERPVLATPVTNWQSHFCPGLGRLSGLSYSPLVSSSSITIVATTTLSTGSYAHSGTQARTQPDTQCRLASHRSISRHCLYLVTGPHLISSKDHTPHKVDHIDH